MDENADFLAMRRLTAFIDKKPEFKEKSYLIDN